MVTWWKFLRFKAWIRVGYPGTGWRNRVWSVIGLHSPHKNLNLILWDKPQKVQFLLLNRISDEGLVLVSSGFFNFFISSHQGQLNRRITVYIIIIFSPFNSQKWQTRNFSLNYPYIIQQTGDEKIQTYRVEFVISIWFVRKCVAAREEN